MRLRYVISSRKRCVSRYVTFRVNNDMRSLVTLRAKNIFIMLRTAT